MYGDKLADDRIDIDALIELDAIWSARQDRFDFVFESKMTSIEADQLIAGAGRAAVIRRQGSVRTVIRDQLQPVPVTYYPSTSIRGGSFNAVYFVPTEDSNDAVLIEYWDNRLFDYKEIVCPVPGVAVEYVENPMRVRLLGVTGPSHAEREGRFLAAAAYYRRKLVSFSTELLGMLPTYGSLIKVAPVATGS